MTRPAAKIVTLRKPYRHFVVLSLVGLKKADRLISPDAIRTEPAVTISIGIHPSAPRHFSLNESP